MKSRVALVTGYVRLPCSHRAHEEYLRLGERLLGLCPRAVAFLDASASAVALPSATRRVPTSREACWLYRDAVEAGVDVAPAGKDTPAYHCVTHQKTAWLAQALEHTDADVLAWVDFGILHNPLITSTHLVDYFERLASTGLARVAAASIWPLGGTSRIPHEHVCWYLAGGVLAAPRRLVRWLDAAIKEEARRHLLSGRFTWEVNTLAAVAQRHPDRFTLYPADHDATLFTGFNVAS